MCKIILHILLKEKNMWLNVHLAQAFWLGFILILWKGYSSEIDALDFADKLTKGLKSSPISIHSECLQDFGPQWREDASIFAAFVQSEMCRDWNVQRKHSFGRDWTHASVIHKAQKCAWNFIMLLWAFSSGMGWNIWFVTPKKLRNKSHTFTTRSRRHFSSLESAELLSLPMFPAQDMTYLVDLSNMVFVALGKLLMGELLSFRDCPFRLTCELLSEMPLFLNGHWCVLFPSCWSINTLAIVRIGYTTQRKGGDPEIPGLQTNCG